MKITAMTLTDYETPVPETVTAVLTIREAAFLARLLGRMTGTQKNEVQSDGNECGSAIWNALAGTVFNPFFEDGYDEVPR